MDPQTKVLLISLGLVVSAISLSLVTIWLVRRAFRPERKYARRWQRVRRKVIKELRLRVAIFYGDLGNKTPVREFIQALDEIGHYVEDWLQEATHLRRKVSASRLEKLRKKLRQAQHDLRREANAGNELLTRMAASIQATIADYKQIETRLDATGSGIENLLHLEGRIDSCLRIHRRNVSVAADIVADSLPRIIEGVAATDINRPADEPDQQNDAEDQPAEAEAEAPADAPADQPEGQPDQGGEPGPEPPEGQGTPPEGQPPPASPAGNPPPSPTPGAGTPPAT